MLYYTYDNLHAEGFATFIFIVSGNNEIEVMVLKFSSRKYPRATAWRHWIVKDTLKNS